MGRVCLFRRFGPLPTFPHQRVWSRVVLVTGVLIYVWYTSKSGNEVFFGRQKEILQQRGQQFECHIDYKKDIEQFPGCVPYKCGRSISDKLVTANEADILLNLAKKGNPV